MFALRLVLDTNIVVSAALNGEGPQRTVFLFSITKPARLFVSQEILAEYREVLMRPKLRIRKGTQRQLLDLIANRSFAVKPRIALEVAGDPADNMFLECADAARADYLITGNVKHFPPFWKSTKVVTAREFISIAVPNLFA
jgi:uncharacterized protein